MVDVRVRMKLDLLRDVDELTWPSLQDWMKGAGLHDDDVRAFPAAFVNAVRRSLAEKHSVVVNGIGEFRLSRNRTVRHPRTGEEIVPRTPSLARFEPAEELLRAVSLLHSSEVQRTWTKEWELRRLIEKEAESIDEIRRIGLEIFKLRERAFEPAEDLIFYLGTVVHEDLFIPASRLEEATKLATVEHPECATMSLHEAMKAEFMGLRIDDEGNVVGVDQGCDCWAIDWLRPIAPVVDEASHFLIMDDEYGFWKVTFEKGALMIYQETPDSRDGKQAE